MDSNNVAYELSSSGITLRCVRDSDSSVISCCAAGKAYLNVVPGSSQKMLTKSSTIYVDSVIYDLEDSVTAESKELARGLVADHIAGDAMQRSIRGPKEVSVRINAVNTGLALQDIQVVWIQDPICPLRAVLTVE